MDVGALLLSALGAKELHFAASPLPPSEVLKTYGGQQPSSKYQVSGREEPLPHRKQWLFDCQSP
jgi:hypothetical protein